MSKKKKLVALYICMCFVYLAICTFSYLEKNNIHIQWPKVKINLIKTYPSFEGANTIK
jgi:hypothetical protein